MRDLASSLDRSAGRLSGRPELDPRRSATTTVFLDFPVPRARLRPATRFRTTWLASSLTALRNRDLMGQYEALLDPSYRDTILGSVAGQWTTVDVALAHYDACDGLNINPMELMAIGREVTERVHGSILATFVRLAKQSGVTPWTALAQLNRLWEKIWEGGGVCVYQVGPKDALIELAAWPLATKQYVTTSMPGVVEGLIGLFCRRAYARYVPRLSDDLTVVLQAQWA